MRPKPKNVAVMQNGRRRPCRQANDESVRRSSHAALFDKRRFLHPLSALFASLGGLATASAGMSWHWNSVPADPGIRDQIAASMDACVGTYNAFSNYNYDIGVVYGSGTPTADAGYLGQIRFGGSRGYHTAMHESSHWLGTGTVGEWDIHFRWGKWNGTYAYNLKTAYDGPGERQSGDGAHYWPYGANSGAEGVQGDIMVHLIGAFRRDMNLWGGDQSIGVPESTYRLRNRQFVKVLDSMDGAAEGAPVKQNENGYDSSQVWNVARVSGTPYFTLQNTTTGKYLDSLGGITDGSPVGLTSLSGGAATDSQQWQILPTDSFFFKIVNKANGLALDNLGASGNGADVAQGTTGASWNQQWTFLHPMPQLTARAGVISQGRPVAASSVESGNYDWKGNDGVVGDRWTASSGSYPQWWRVDTGSAQPITKVEIDWLNTGNRSYQYRIEVSDDATNWTVAADRTGNTVCGTTVDSIAATGRYVRVYVTGSSGGYASFNECRVYNEAKPMKLVSEFRPTSASSEQAGNLAVNATDMNSIHTRWCSASSGYPAWWQVDLGSPQQVNKAVIQWFDDSGRYYKYRIEGSNDGVNYTTLIDRTGNTQPQTTTDEFSGVARYVRVMITGGSITWPSMYDVQIYSASSAVSAYAPQNLSATPSGNQIALNWPAVEGATSYTVKRSVTPGGPYVTVGTPSSASFIDSAMVAGVSYYYVVTATNPLGTSGNSPEASALVNAELQVNLPFDEASGDVAADISGYNRDGSLFTWPVWGVGNTGSAIDLDGLDDYVALPQGVVSQLNDFTIATWVNPEVLSSWARVFDFGTGTNNYMFLTSSTGGSVRFAIRTPSVGEQRLTGTMPLATGVWSHIAVTLSGTNATLYVNGVAVATNNAMTLKPSSLGSTTQNWIGRSQFADPYFNGNVDDFRIYNRALTGNEIDKLRGAVSPAAPSSLAIQRGDGQASISWAATVGATSYQVKRSTTPGGPYTVIATVSSPGYVDGGLSNGTSYYYVVSSLNGTLEGSDSSEIALTPTDAVPDAPAVLTVVEAGTHVKLAWPPSPEATLYSVKRSLTSGGPYQILASVTSPEFTDAAVTPGATYYYVVSATGAAGESSNSSQAAAQPSSISPLARFQMDEGQGTVIEDASGNGWNGSLINGPGRVAGKLDGAISLDGVNDHALLPDGVVSGVGDCTISAWVKASNVGTWSRLFDFGTGTDNYLFLSLKAGSGKPRFAIRTSATSEEIIESGVAFPLNVWTHVAVSFTGNTGTLYLNGEAVGANSAMTLKPSSLGITTKNYLGRSQFADPYFAGQIDEFQITSRAMTAGEIADSATPPTAPANLAATPSGLTMNLVWDPAAGTTGYNVERATVSGGPYATIANNVSTTSYADSGLAAGTTYYYVVTALKTVAESARSTEAGATTTIPVPGVPSGLVATTVSTSAIDLGWNASDGAASYSVKRSTFNGGPYSTIATDLAATSYRDSGLTNGMTYYYVVSAENLGGESADSAQTSATTLQLPPSPWVGSDIGTVGVAGSASYSNGVYTLKGSGSDIWGTADAFQYVSQSLTGDGEIRARVTSQTNTDPWAKAGVMIRDGSGAGAAHVLMTLTPGNGFSFQWRSSSSGATTATAGSVANVAPNNWVRLTRSGNLLTGYASTDGVIWTQQGTATIAMSGTVTLGLAVTSHNNAVLGTAAFDNVAITPFPSPWASADIGTTGLTGSAEYFGNAYTVKGAGVFGGFSDGFRYIYQPLSADGSIIARVSNLQNTGSNARVGIMIRDTLANNSRMAALTVTGAGAYKWERRTTTGGNASTTNSSSGSVPNIWIRLVRSGNTVTASKSANGTSWTTIGSATVTMASNCYIGLVVASGSTTTLNTSIVDNVTAAP